MDRDAASTSTAMFRLMETPGDSLNNLVTVVLADGRTFVRSDADTWTLHMQGESSVVTNRMMQYELGIALGFVEVPNPVAHLSD